MIAVDDHLVLGHIGDGVDARFARLLGAAFELHADLQVGWKELARLHPHQRGFVLAESILRFERDLTAKAGLFAFERLLHGWKYALIAAVKIADGLLCSFDDLAVLAEQLIR